MDVCHSPHSNNIFQAQACGDQEYNNIREMNISHDKLPQTQSVISKLNPEVKEFVPSSIKYTNVPRNDLPDYNTPVEFNNGKHSPVTRKVVTKTPNNDSTNQNARKEIPSPESSKVSHETGRNGAGDGEWVINKETKDRQLVMQDETIPIDSDVQMCTKDEEKMKIIAMLKEQISKIPKDSPFYKRKDKNVAIAALIKTNTIPSATSNLTPSSSSPKTILLTPEYFKGPCTAENQDAQDQENLVVPSHRMSPPKLHEEDSSKDNENIEDNVLEENITPKTDVTPVRTPIDPYMQESINKVNNWFNSPPASKSAKLCRGATTDVSKRKPAEPYLGTFMFKKKSVSDRNSSISSSKSPVLTTPTYVPSKYAQDLVKKYEERNQVKEMHKEEHMDIWTKLERDLKIKDEEYRLRIRQKEAENNNNNAS